MERTSKLVSMEIRQLNKVHASTILDPHDEKKFWEGIELLTGKMKRICLSVTGLEKHSEEFVNCPQGRGLLILPSCFQPFGRMEIKRTMKALNGNKAGGLDVVSPTAHK